LDTPGKSLVRRGKIETEASRVPDRKAGSAEIVAHLRSGPPRFWLVEGVNGAWRDIKAVSEVQAAKLSSADPKYRLVRRPLPKMAATLFVRQRSVGRGGDIGRELRRKRRASKEPNCVSGFIRQVS
jgi:hypothetical protein